MSQEQPDIPSASVDQETDPALPRKDWVTPQVSESPVNEFTQAGGGTPSSDANAYS